MTNIKPLNPLTAKLLVAASLLLTALSTQAQDWSTVTTVDTSVPEKRHESAATVVDGKIYLIGGRGERNVDVYDPQSNTWQSVSPAPLELHHFQSVVYAGKIYIIGAFTCCYPTEPTIADIHVFDPATNSWSIEGSMPANRLRGAAGTVVHQNKIYIVGGNTMGHDGGAVNWFDEYDPATGVWRVLPDAPYARDHFSAAIANGRLVAAGGRQSQRSFANTVAPTDVYDFASGAWISTAHNIPTPRAGTMAAVYNNKVFVIGGESGFQTSAHDEVQVFSPASGLWSQIKPMVNPRHAGGSAVIGNDLHVFTGSNVRGASGEFDGHEKIDLSQASLTPMEGTPPLLLTQDTDLDGLPDYDESNTHNTNPQKYDTDDDGINDFDELYVTNTNPNTADTDNDGLDDNAELDLNLDPNNPDFDNDGLSDGDEILVYGSNPNDIDSDNDNLTDIFEVQTLNSNPAEPDTDNDGLRDDLEYLLYGTKVSEADTDGDNVDDGTEINLYASDPLAEDSDGDGVLDGDEIKAGSSLTNTDEDGDGLLNSADGQFDADGDGFPNYLDRDSDNDGIPDLIENGFSDVDRDGVIDTLEEIDAANEIEIQKDKEEQERKKEVTVTPDIDTIDPQHTVRDTRSVSMADDGAEESTSTDTSSIKIAPKPVGVALDSDDDGIPNHVDLDSDQDGISDLVESSSNYSSNTLSMILTTDTNSDGLEDSYNAVDAYYPVDTDSDNTPNYLDLDSDNDGEYDLVEAGNDDIDGNGMLDDVIDNNNDGIADLGIPALGEALPDEDNDNIPDLIDTVIETGGRFGCTIASAGSKSAADPTLPALLLLLIFQLMRRRQSTAT